MSCLSLQWGPYQQLEQSLQGAHLTLSLLLWALSGSPEPVTRLIAAKRACQVCPLTILPPLLSGHIPYGVSLGHIIPPPSRSPVYQCPCLDASRSHLNVTSSDTAKSPTIATRHPLFLLHNIHHSYIIHEWICLSFQHPNIRMLTGLLPNPPVAFTRTHTALSSHSPDGGSHPPACILSSRFLPVHSLSSHSSLLLFLRKVSPPASGLCTCSLLYLKCSSSRSGLFAPSRRALPLIFPFPVHPPDPTVLPSFIVFIAIITKNHLIVMVSGNFFCFSDLFSVPPN